MSHGMLAILIGLGFGMFMSSLILLSFILFEIRGARKEVYDTLEELRNHFEST